MRKVRAILHPIILFILPSLPPLAAADRGPDGEELGLGKMFSDPNILAKLAANPRTQKLLADPTFVQKVYKWRSPSQSSRFSNKSFYRYR